MKGLALLVALLIIVIGIVLVVVPDRVTAVEPYLITPVGLFVLGALRVGMGLLLVAVASTSRAPKGLRVLGGVFIVAGLMTPMVGVERVRAFADWGAAQGPGLMRGIAAVMFVTGGFIAFAVRAGRRPASRSHDMD